ncbi:RNase H domain-containing protein [Trichonephila clavipes]|nr:RNase H domain-containing protein [Trichonephila clavipes]
MPSIGGYHPYGLASILTGRESNRACVEYAWPTNCSPFRIGTTIHLQWVPSHVGLFEDDLEKAATSNPVDPEDHMVLTSTEIYSRAKELICRTWEVPPVHPWYFQRHPGSAISFKGSR